MTGGKQRMNLLRFILCSIWRLLTVPLLMFSLHFCPEQAYRFSLRKCLPSKAMRLKKDERLVMPYILQESRTSSIPRMKEANIVLIGASFSIEQIEELEGPVFLVSFWDPIRIKKDVVYIMGQAENALRLAKLGCKVIYPEVCTLDWSYQIIPYAKDHIEPWYEEFINNGSCQRISLIERIFCLPKYYSNAAMMIGCCPASPEVMGQSKWVPHLGSGIPAICAMSYFADKVNVYGWDFYLDSPPYNMTYWGLFSKMYDFKRDIWGSRRDVFESAMMNFFYGYYFSKLPNINVHGRMGQLYNHKKLIGKIERALFR